MSLIVTLRINKTPQAQLTVTRITEEIGQLPQAVNQYEVTLDGTIVGEVEHTYGDGAGVLAVKALQLAVVEGLLRT